VFLRANLGLLEKGNFHTLGYRNKYNADQSEGHGGFVPLAKQLIMKVCWLCSGSGSQVNSL